MRKGGGGQSITAAHDSAEFPSNHSNSAVARDDLESGVVELW